MDARAAKGTLIGLTGPVPIGPATIEDADTEPGSRATHPPTHAPGALASGAPTRPGGASQAFASGERARSAPGSAYPTADGAGADSAADSHAASSASSPRVAAPSSFVEDPVVCQPGQRFGEVVITRLVTRGGMGEVYEAFHEHMEQRLALKVLRPNFRSRPEFVERFRDEGRMLAAICQKEPNVVQIRNVGFDERCGPYITMEWLVGKNFRDLQKAWGGRMPLAQTVAHTITVADVTHRVHRLGLIHRDLKPENLFLEKAARDVPGAEPRLVLLDLGISKRAGGERTTDENRNLGTIEYMSPEQIESGTATARSDQYAIGHMLFEMLQGEHAYANQMRAALLDGGEARRQLVVISAHLFSVMPVLDSDLAPTVRLPDGSSLSLTAITQRAMRRAPAERYPSMEAFASDLRAWLAAYRGGSPAAAPETNPSFRRLDDPPARAPSVEVDTRRSPNDGLGSGVGSATSPSPAAPVLASRAKLQPTLPPQSMRVDPPQGAIESVAQTDFVAAYSLIVVSRTGDALARYPLLRAVIVVGRGVEECDVVLADPTVSRVHCELRHVSPGVFQVVDLGSVHGLVLRGMPTKSGLVRTNDRMTLGHVDLRLCPPGCFRKLANGGWTFVPSLFDLPQEERATVRMVGNAATPQGPILDAEKVLARVLPKTLSDGKAATDLAGRRAAGAKLGASSSERSSSASLPPLAGDSSVVRTAMFVFALTLLIGVGGLALLRLTGFLPDGKPSVINPTRSP